MASSDAPQLAPLMPNAGPPQPPPPVLNVPGPAPGQPQLPPLAPAFPIGERAAPPVPTPPPATMPTPVAPRSPSGGPPQVRPVSAGWLLPLAGSVGVERVALPQSRPFRVGRDQDAEMWLFDERISRQHARIDYLTRPAGFVVTDLDSRNGVFVNGRRIAAPTLLQPGDQVAFATNSNAVFRFEAE